jgi:preprotein translocase subunit YajC
VIDLLGSGNWLLFAKDQPGLLSQLGIWPALIGTFLLFYFIVLRPQRREQANQRALLDNLKKNDRVVTIGGIYGVVTNVEREKDRVKLRVDEKTNAEVTFTFGAISRVLRDEPAEKTAK